MDGATKHISGKMTCWPISSCVLRSPGRTGSRVWRGQEGMAETSGSMFSWLLRDPQRVRWGLYMFSRVDISVVPQWKGIRDFKRLSKSVLLCPTSFQGSILMGSSLKQHLHLCIPTREAEREREKSTPKHTLM